MNRRNSCYIEINITTAVLSNRGASNQVGTEGAAALLAAVPVERAGGLKPLWLRLEWNQIDAGELARFIRQVGGWISFAGFGGGWGPMRLLVFFGGGLGEGGAFCCLHDAALPEAVGWDDGSWWGGAFFVVVCMMQLKGRFRACCPPFQPPFSTN